MLDFCIEDGYNTSYICIALLAFLYEYSMIERCLLLENNTFELTSTYLQKLIKYNFIERARNNICITSDKLNEIRLFSYLLGWHNDNIFDNYEPIDYINFLAKQVNYIPIETMTGNYYQIDIVNQEKCNIQELYNTWACNKTIINIPIYITIKLNTSVECHINKKIHLFPTEHSYNVIKWIFHSMFYKDDDGKHKIILSLNNKLYRVDLTQVPCVSTCDIASISNTKNKDIYIVYRKEPLV